MPKTLSVKAILSSFPEINESIISRVEKIVLNMANLMQVESVGIAIQMGRILSNPTWGRYRLRRIQIRIDTKQFKKIRTFQKTGKITEAQFLILDILENNLNATILSN